MDLGMPALLELDGAEPCAVLCRELRLRFIELNLNLPAYQPGEADVPSLRSIAEKYGIYYTIHMDENLNPWDLNPRVAEAYRQAAEEAIGLAKALEAPVLTMHLPAGVYFTLPEGRSYTECDIDTLGAKSRGAKRIVFSDDGLIYYTEDHYESFELLYGDEGDG